MDDVFDKIKKDINKATDKAVNKIFLGALGRIAAKDIKTRTRLGKGVPGDGMRQEKLKKLSTKYKKQRKKDKKKGLLSRDTTPGRSNLTRTGQLLDSIESTVKTKDTIEIGFKESRDDKKKNIDIVGYQEDQNRPFFYLSKPEQTRLNRLVVKKIERELSKID